MPGELSGLRVLLVDDDVDALQVMGLVLEMQGATVRCAASAPGALQGLTGFRPDVLVTDLAMPEFSGTALLGAFREKTSDGPRIPALAVSGVSDADEALGRGFDAFLPKPVDPERFIRAVRDLADHAASQTSEPRIVDRKSRTT
jgi:CheY-like chemotaxis protein